MNSSALPSAIPLAPGAPSPAGPAGTAAPGAFASPDAGNGNGNGNGNDNGHAGSTTSRSSLSAPPEAETPDLSAQDALRDAPDIAPGKADPPLPLPTPLPRPEQQFTAPVDVRSLSLALLALFASIAVLHWAAAVFIPVALSVLITSALSPAVSGLQRWHVPRWLGAAVLLMALVGVLSATVWKLGDGASQVIESLPVAVKKVRDKLRDDAGKKVAQGTPAASSPLETVQAAAAQLEQAAAENAAPAAAPKRGVQRVQIERSPFNIRDYLWSGTMGLLSAVGSSRW